jgi:hypothetical protein
VVMRDGTTAAKEAILAPSRGSRAIRQTVRASGGGVGATASECSSRHCLIAHPAPAPRGRLQRFARSQSSFAKFPANRMPQRVEGPGRHFEQTWRTSHRRSQSVSPQRTRAHNECCPQNMIRSMTRSDHDSHPDVVGCKDGNDSNRVGRGAERIRVGSNAGALATAGQPRSAPSRAACLRLRSQAGSISWPPRIPWAWLGMPMACRLTLKGC